MPTDQAKIVANGINGATGQYDFAPRALAEIARALKGIPPDAAEKDHVVTRGKKLQQPAFTRALPFGVPPDNIARAGWAVVFHKDEKPAVRQKLSRLIDLRRRQVGDDARVKELTYNPGENATEWLKRHDASWHNVEPTKIPYYLLWVGSPALMPLEVAHEIDSDYCVGLLAFDTPEEYAQYAKSVEEYETATAVRNTREVVFFGTRHPFDQATVLSADWLVTPLADGMAASGSTPAEKSVAEQLGFRRRKLLGDGATRQALLQILDGAGSTPSLLFTASHGLVWPNGDARQLAAQGALLCQDWPGFGGVGPAHYVTAADVPDTARVHGLIAFHFACYGAGTPQRDLYFFERGQQPPPIAPSAFLAALPRRLLAHPAGGALACIGHIERAWGSSITGIAASPQIRQFQNAIANMLVGKPVGI